MDFVRKNLGFVIFSLVCIVLLIAMIILDRKAAARLAEVREKADRQQDFIRQISRGKYALNKTNVNLANRNYEIAKTELNDFLSELKQNYTYERPGEGEMPGGVECLGRVRTTVREMSALLSRRNIQTQEEQYFSFDELAKSSYPPPQSQVPLILKQLDMAALIVQAAADSPVTEFHTLERLDMPGQEPDIRRGGYQSALYRVGVTGTAEQLRTFINNLNETEQMLLLIKEPEISREKRDLGRQQTPRDRRGSQDRSRNNPDRELQEGTPGMQPPPEEMNETDDEPSSLPREQRRVFNPQPLQATITIGLLEFRAPDMNEDS